MVTVVPMPFSSGCSKASSMIRESAALTAVWNCSSTFCAPPSSLVKNHRKVLSVKCSMAATAMALARSPALWPPMPSATRNRWARSSATCTFGSGKLVCHTRMALLSSVITNWSSLVSRTAPRSVMPKVLTVRVGDSSVVTDSFIIMG